MSEDVTPEIIQKTQKSLGKYVKKPALTDKLLRKPPFRFLHDVVTSVIHNTGFLRGLYTESEMLSENVKDKDSKVAFLTKLIEAVKGLTGEDLMVRPSKIIAGLEPTQTNLLLQAIGKALDRKIDSSSYVQKLKSAKKPSKDNKLKESSKTSKSRSSDKSSKKSNESVDINSERKEKKGAIRATPREQQELLRKSKKTSSGMKIDEQPEKSKPDETKASKRSNSTRRKETNSGNTKEDTARKSSKEQEVKVQLDDEIEQSSRDQPLLKVEDVVAAPEIPPELEETVETKSNLEKPSTPPLSTPAEVPSTPVEKSLTPQPFPLPEPRPSPRINLRPPTVRPSSARPGAPRLRADPKIPMEEVVPMGGVNIIIENYGTKGPEEDEEDTVVVQLAAEEQPIATPLPSNIPSDKGHLVEQILQQMKDDEGQEHAKSLVDIEWEQNSSRSKNAVIKEVEFIKSAIQNFTKTANPLGKLINYLHEDIETMHTEIDKWMNLRKQISSDISVEQRATKEFNEVLQAKLVEIDDSIRQQSNLILSLQSTVLQNETQIQSLLAK